MFHVEPPTLEGEHGLPNHDEGAYDTCAGKRGTSTHRANMKGIVQQPRVHNDDSGVEMYHLRDGLL